MEQVRYQPGEAIRWLETGASDSRKNAKIKSRAVTLPDDLPSLKKNVQSVAGALLDLGKGALADLLHSQAMATEYVLHEDGFEMIKPNSTKRILFQDIKGFAQRGDRTDVLLENGSVAIKPYAYVVAGRIRVPIGWSRNGIEVPFDLLLEEISARSGVELP